MSQTIIDKISKQAQDYYKETPVVILGSGASAAFGMSGMWDLSIHLIKNIYVDDLSESEQSFWSDFCSLLKEGIDLESALHKITLSQVLTSRIVESTWNLLVPQDIDIFEKSLNNRSLFSLGKLLKHMLRSTQSQLNIITPNYDRLAEYACEQENIHHYSGFSSGYSGHIVAENYLTCARQVNIWKVHGSLGWFLNKDSVITSLGHVNSIPKGLTPLIVTPGIEKYKSTHKEPYKTTIHKSDDVLDTATSYLCIGFGFNDEHIQEKLVNRCSSGDASIVIITYKLSESAKKFLFNGSISKYLAIEIDEDDKHSVIYSSLFKESVILEDNYWSLDGFLNLII